MRNAPSALRAGAAAFLWLCSNFGIAIDSVSMTCEKIHFNVPPVEWFVAHESTPSDIYELKVQLHLSEENQLPLLNITWIINPDGSIQELKATVIYIQSTQEFCLRCNYNASFKSPLNPQHQLWQFHYTEYPVDPDTFYTVKAYNIPTSNNNEYAPEKSAEIKTPGCEHETMKNHKNCEDALWKPNISVCLVNNDVVINFTTVATSFGYDVKLAKCDVYSSRLNQTTIPKSNGSRISITFVRNDVLDLSKHLCVGIKPYFSECEHYCKRQEVVLRCSIRDEHTIPNHLPEAGEDKPSIGGLFICFIGLCVILVILGAVLLISKLGKANERKFITDDTELQQPVKVLIIYSVDDELFRNVILAFADFLHSFNGIQVIIDIWQRRNIAETGPAQWLAFQKEKADKIIVVISKSAKMKWDAICCKTSIDQKLSYSEDIFSIALNMFCSDMQHNSHLHKYCIVYFDTICSAKDVPSIYSSCVKYCLGKDINKLFKNLLNSSDKIHSKCCSLLPYYNYKTLYNLKMKNVNTKLKDWQYISPTSIILVNELIEKDIEFLENIHYSSH